MQVLKTLGQEQTLYYSVHFCLFKCPSNIQNIEYIKGKKKECGIGNGTKL